MPKVPTTWTPETNQPSGFQPYGAANPTVFANNDNAAPTNWSNEDVKNPTTYSTTGKNATSFAPSFGLTFLTYDTLGSMYDDPTVTYDQTTQNQATPAQLDTAWSTT